MLVPQLLKDGIVYTLPSFIARRDLKKSGYLSESEEKFLQIKSINFTDIVDSFEFSNDTKTFAEMLIFYLNIRNEKASNFYRAVNIDRRLFSKILNNDYHPSKDTIIRMCIGLRLTLNQSVDLLSRADYAFNPSKAMDLVIMRGISENKSFFEIKDDLKKAGFNIWN